MLIQDIVNYVNDKLAGERYTYDQIKKVLDSCIDDINTKLSSTYPAFSELALGVSSYGFFPDRYIRTVVVIGAASKLFAIDEEGQVVSPIFDKEYIINLFTMLRDFGPSVPDAYLNIEQGLYEGGNEFYGLPDSAYILDGGNEE